MRNLLWLDLETTGLDEHTGSILEIGAVLTDPSLATLYRDRTPAEFTLIVNPLEEEHVTEADEVVRRLHEESGLWEDLRLERENGRTVSVHEADLALSVWLDAHRNGEHLILAGSGVGHFDRRWIERHLPNVAWRLAHYFIDVGVIRRFFRDVVGATALIESVDAELGAIPHRALEDVHRHIAEAQRYRSWLTSEA